MNAIYNLSTQLFYNWKYSFSRHLSKAIRSILLSSFLNNILGSIAAISATSLIMIGGIHLSGYPLNPSLTRGILFTAISLLVITLSLLMVFTTSSQIEKMLDLNASPSSSPLKGSPTSLELISFLKDIIEKQNSKHENSETLKKLEEVLYLSMETIKELETRIQNLEESNPSTFSHSSFQ